MGSAIQMLSVALGLLGLVAAVVCCAVPLWKQSAFVGQNIVTAQYNYEGLWMSCVGQSTGQQQCKSYDSLLALAPDLQAARAMVMISCMLCGLSLLILFTGANFTTCVQNESAKPKIRLVAAVGLLLAGLLLFIPVSWSANTVIKDFNNQLNQNKKELGPCIFIGWAGGALLLLAGGLLCCFNGLRGGGGGGGAAKYYANSSAPPSKNYV
ncbi:claudin i [Amia ocellicauda]|uniref:claudin i n=1 Tax=Amia ocellicauda TaxID=2972642 RepID=UPI003464B44F